MVLTNVVLNYILIFGKFGFPALGIAGAAIASSISEAVSVLFFVIYTWKKIDYKKYGLFRFTRVDFRMLGQILSVSILGDDPAWDRFWRMVYLLYRYGASG